MGEFIEKNNNDYSDFYTTMKSYQQYNKGKEITVLRRLWIKYIYKGESENKEEIDILYNDLDSEIENAKDETTLDTLLNQLENDLNNGVISETEFHFLSDKVISKWRKLLEDGTI